MLDLRVCLSSIYEAVPSMETNNHRSKQFIPLLISTLIHCVLIFLLFTYKELIEQIASSQEKQKHTIIPVQIILPQGPKVSSTIPTPQSHIQPAHPVPPAPSPQTPSQSTSIDQPTPVTVPQEQPYREPRTPALQTVDPSTSLKSNYLVPTNASCEKKNDQTEQTIQNPPSRKLTLKDITKGLFKSINQSQALIENKTHTQGVHTHSIPDARSLALKAYQTKTYNVLQQSVNTIGKSLSFTSNIDVIAMLSITVDKKGVLKNLTLEYSPKTDNIIRLENHLKQAAHSAGLFPPIPSHLNETSITHTYRLQIKAYAGTDYYYLSPATY